MLLRNIHLEDAAWIARLCSVAGGATASTAGATASSGVCPPPHATFRLIVTAQVPSLTSSSSSGGSGGSGGAQQQQQQQQAAAFPSHLPPSLLMGATKLVLETRPGVRATFLGTLSRVASQLAPWEGALAPLAARIAWAHTLIMERRRYGLLGWTSCYDFGDGDLDSALETLRLLERQQRVGGGAAAAAAAAAGPTSLLLPSLRRLLADAIYGARLESSADEGTMARLISTSLTGEVVSLEGLLLREGGAAASLSGSASGSSSLSHLGGGVAGGAGLGPIRCPAFLPAAAAAAASSSPAPLLGVWEGWASAQLPPVLSPTVLGLSAQTDTQQMVRGALEILRVAALL